MINEYEWSDLEIESFVAEGGGNKAARKKWYGRYDQTKGVR